MSASDDAVAQIKARANLVELAQARTRLRRQNRRWVGLCPFHEEKTPSFSVNEQMQQWYCFGCQRGGDVFDFIQESEKTDFKGALERLAEMTGVELAQESGARQERARTRRSIVELNEFASRYFQHVLHETPAGEPGRKLLAERGVDRATAERFALGYAPGERNLQSFLSSRSRPIPLAIEAGLLRRGGGDYFERRLMLPIRDERGQTVAFTARDVTGQDRRKYLNSPESPAYQKGHVLFGLDLAKGAIGERGRAVLMEGQFDVISAHAAGVAHALASSGTALTPDQMVLLRRFTEEVLLVFDSDAAGKRAALSVIEMAQEHDLRVQVGRIPEGAKDPDQYLRQGGSWEQIEKAAVPGWEFWIRSSIEGLTPSRPDDLERAVNAVNLVLGKIRDPAVREAYRRKAALWLELEEHLLVFRTAPAPRAPGRAAAAAPRPEGGRGGAGSATAQRRRPVFEYLIRLLVARPELAAGALSALGEEDLGADEAETLQRIAEALKVGGGVELEHRLGTFPEPDRALVRRAWADPPPDGDEKGVMSIVARLKQDGSRRRRLAIIRDLQEAERSGETARASQLLEEYGRIRDVGRT